MCYNSNYQLENNKGDHDMKKLFSMVMAMLMAFSLAACGDKDTGNADEIVVGVNYEMSGAVADYGNAHVDGIKLAVDEINAAGGVNGKTIKLVINDNKGDTNEIATVATKQMTEDNVVVVLGPATSGATKAAINVGNKYKVPVISASATSDDVTLNKDGSVTEYGFKICYSDTYQGTKLANFAVSQKAMKAVIFADSSSDYAKGLSKAFTDAYTKANGTIVATENYVAGDADFNAQLTNLKGKEFDVMFIPGYYQEAGLIVKQAREMGITAMILGPDGFDSQDFIDQAGTANCNNVYFSTHFSRVDKVDAVTNFVKAYKDEYGSEPGCFHALGYDLAYYLKDVLNRVEGDITSESVTKALNDTEAVFTGVTGSFSMKDDHTPEKAIKVVELKDGVQVAAYTVD